MTLPSFSQATILLFRIALVLALMAGGVIGMLKLLERAGDPLRQGIESYLAQTTRSHVYVGSLPRPQFFPNVHITMKDVVFSAPSDPAMKRATADTLEFAVPFLYLLTGQQAFETLTITNLRLEKDVISPVPMVVEKMAIDPATPPALVASGQYGKATFAARLDLQPRGDGPVYYTLPHHTPFSMTLGSLKLGGALDSSPEGLQLQDVVMQDSAAKQAKNYGPKSFFIMKNQEFIKDNPVSCLMGQSNDLKLTATHPCATLFELTMLPEGQE